MLAEETLQIARAHDLRDLGGCGGLRLGMDDEDVAGLVRVQSPQPGQSALRDPGEHRCAGDPRWELVREGVVHRLPGENDRL